MALLPLLLLVVMIVLGPMELMEVQSACENKGESVGDETADVDDGVQQDTLDVLQSCGPWVGGAGAALEEEPWGEVETTVAATLVPVLLMFQIVVGCQSRSEESVVVVVVVDGNDDDDDDGRSHLGYGLGGTKKRWCCMKAGMAAVYNV
jgi:hypothetical protein